MAIIEIAKIQVRRGQEEITGLPQLDSGEFGWAVDTQRLFIGNGSLEEGARELGNTEIITEHTIPNIFNLPSYSYIGHSPSPVQTDTTRTVFSKLDDFVTVLDFGATGDGVTEDTKAIQRAIDQLFLNSDKSYEASRRTLLFPAGKYVVTSTIYVPPYANILGEGPEKTKLELTTSTAGIFQFCDSSSVGAGTYTVFVTGLTNISSNDKPKNISITGITFHYGNGTDIASAVPLLRVDCAEDTSIVNCKFSGNHSTNLLSSSNYMGIDIRGQGAIISKNIKIENCTFDQIKFGVKSNYDAENITIDNNKFIDLFQGVVFANSIEPNNVTGPINSKITNNLFENIEYEGIYVGLGGNVTTPRNNISAYNTFRQVGNNMSVAGDLDPASSIIYFQAPGCKSVCDVFERDENIKTLGTSTTVYIAPIKGRLVINETVASTASLVTSLVPYELAKIPYSDTDQKIDFEYIVSKQSLGISRKGNLLINVNKVSPSPTVTFTENYSYVGSSDGGVEFSVGLNTATNTIYVYYTSINSIGSLEFNHRIFQ